MTDGDSKNRYLIMKFVIAAFLAVAGSSATAAAGYFKTGNDLVRECRLPPPSYTALTYAIGVVDGFETAQNNNNRTYCIPSGVTAGQINDIACQYVEKHPEQRQAPAPFLIIASVSAAFPCQ